MNELCKLFLNIKSGDFITLEHKRIYHICQDDSFSLDGYYCSNTAKKHENPNGHRDVAVFLKEKENVTIDGNSATLMIHGKMTPILFDHCNNISVKNLTIDYACPTMSEFKILSNENGICKIRINDECLYKTEKKRIIWHGENDLNGKPYWENYHNANGRHFKLYDPETELTYDLSRADVEFEEIKPIDERTLQVTLKNKDIFFPAGYIVQTRNIIRDQTGSMFERCKNLSFENLQIKFMHGLGMVSQYCENVTFKNCDFTPKEGRTVASTADFFQFSGCRGNLIIDNCKAKGAHDDYINVHGTHLRIVEKKNNTITVRFMHDETWGFQAFTEKDTIDFIKWDTLIPYFTSTVKSFGRINDTDILLTLDNLPGEIKVGSDVVENASWTPNLFVRNCDFGPTSGRGILCTTRGNVIIESNRFHKLWGPALLIEDDCNFWFESGFTKNIIFKNNEIVSCDHHVTYSGAPAIRYTPKVLNENTVEFVHGKLTVTGNVFKNAVCDSHAIHLEHLKEAFIENNSFDTSFNITAKNVGCIDCNNNKISTKNHVF